MSEKQTKKKRKKLNIKNIKKDINEAKEKLPIPYDGSILMTQIRAAQQKDGEIRALYDKKIKKYFNLFLKKRKN